MSRVDGLLNCTLGSYSVRTLPDVLLLSIIGAAPALKGFWMHVTYVLLVQKKPYTSACSLG